MLKRCRLVAKPKRRLSRAQRAARVDKEKGLGRMLVEKGPVRDIDHLSRVRTAMCLVCASAPPNEAHHLRIGLRTMGVRQPDSRCVPLCPKHHLRLHKMNEEEFWADIGIDPLPIAAALYRQSLALRSVKAAADGP